MVYAPFLEDILNRHLDELSWEEADDTGVPEDEAINPIQTQIQNLLKAARSLEANDPKLEALRNIIREKQNLPNNKVMLFSSFRHTLSYLFDHLSRGRFPRWVGPWGDSGRGSNGSSSPL